jgi:hypothetical protein
MKKNILGILLAFLFLTSCVVYVPYEGEGGPPPQSPPSEDRYDVRDSDAGPYETGIDYFYEYLSPYGIWVSLSSYGYVWVPSRVGPRWRPYTYGRWVWTNYGWTWVSYYEWGWVPFHYGRWGWDGRLGWFWVPDTAWAPAWVTWRWGNLYIGWAPLPPNVAFIPGVGIRDVRFDFPHSHWIFIEGRYFQYDYLDRYVLPFERNPTIINFTVRKANLSMRNRQVINDGVDIDQIRQLTRTEVSRYQLEDARRPGESRVRGNTVDIYRPVVRKSEAAKPASAVPEARAEERVREIRKDELEGRASSADIERRLRDEQDREMKLLEESQRREEAELRRRAEDEKKLAARAAEKEKTEKEYEVKAKELNKSHQDEKSKINERHEEEKKAVKGRIKKKGEN